MAITYPRSFPSEWKHGPSEFKLLFRQSVANTWGGRNQVSELGPALWFAKYSTTILSRVKLRACQAWLDSLRGGMGTFYGYDPSFQYPATDHPQGPISIGSPTLNGTDTTNSDLDLTGATSGYELKAGDYLSFDHPTAGGEVHRALYRVLEDTTLTGGAATNIPVRPRVLSGAGTGQAVTFEKAACEMRVLAETIKVNTDDTGAGRVEFDALQVIRV